MPDHIIGLLVFGSDPLQGAQVTLGTVIGAFKSLTTLEFGKGVRDSGWLRFESKLWLENYYERVVRNDGELEQIRNYITANPSRWWEKYGDGHPQGV
jgi:REP element-mobilizing transposase RayT